jgi:hypothetical protein
VLLAMVSAQRQAYVKDTEGNTVGLWETARG